MLAFIGVAEDPTNLVPGDDLVDADETPSPMSALPPKADIHTDPRKCLLLTQSGHWMLGLIQGVSR